MPGVFDVNLSGGHIRDVHRFEGGFLDKICGKFRIRVPLFDSIQNLIYG